MDISWISHFQLVNELQAHHQDAEKKSPIAALIFLSHVTPLLLRMIIFLSQSEAKVIWE